MEYSLFGSQYLGELRPVGTSTKYANILLFGTGYFVMVPLNLTCQYYLQQSFVNTTSIYIDMSTSFTTFFEHFFQFKFKTIRLIVSLHVQLTILIAASILSCIYSLIIPNYF